MTKARQTTFTTRVRLFVDAPLAASSPVEASDAQSHYLNHVMRLEAGDQVELFNGRDGGWLASIQKLGKKSCELLPVEQLQRQKSNPDLWLLFAPIKRQRIDFLVEKATELGAALLQPVKTRFTNSSRVNLERLRAHCIEAAEQTGRLSVPQVNDMISLEALIAQWDVRRKILFCDEAMEGDGIAVSPDQTLAGLAPGPWAVLTGPEGGFEPSERETLRSKPYIVPISLGPRILRADTAAVAALTLWQSKLGDWQ